MARIRPKTSPERGAELSIAWRASANVTRRRAALIGAIPSAESVRFQRLSIRALAAKYGHLDRRLAYGDYGDRSPLSAGEAAELARLEAIADELRGA